MAHSGEKRPARFGRLLRGQQRVLQGILRLFFFSQVGQRYDDVLFLFIRLNRVKARLEPAGNRIVFTDKTKFRFIRILYTVRERQPFLQFGENFKAALF